MSTLVAGGDPDELYHLGRVLGDAAEELRRMQARTQWGTAASRQPSEPAVIVARVRTWTAEQSVDVQRRARQLDNDRTHLYEWDDKPLLGMAAHGKRRLTLTHASDQLQQAQETLKDPNASPSAKADAQKLLNRQGKKTADRASRQSKDAKPKPSSSAEREARQTARDIRTSATETARKEVEDAAGRAPDQAETIRRASAKVREAAIEAAEKAAEEAGGRPKSEVKLRAREAARKAANEAIHRARKEAADKAELEELEQKVRDGDDGLTKAVAGAGAVIAGVWWAGKVLSPGCGPLVLVCAGVL